MAKVFPERWCRRAGAAAFGIVVLAGCHPRARVRAGSMAVVAARVAPTVQAPRYRKPTPHREPIPAGWLLIPILRAPVTAVSPAWWPAVPPPPAECEARCVLLISTEARTLSLVAGGDTLFRAPVAVASGVTLVHQGRSWTFRTPPGERRVLRKIEDPVWTPPDWHYAEAAREHGLRLERLTPSGVVVSGDRRLEVRGGVVGVIRPGEPFRALPTSEHIVFDGRLFIPPAGTRNRRLTGDLGRFALDLGNGYMIHGTPDQASIGRATTHGCIRLRDPDIAWLYSNVPVGTRVVIR